MARVHSVFHFADLTALAACQKRENRAIAFIASGKIFVFDISSTEDHDGVNVIKQATLDSERPGRWLLLPGGSTPGEWEIAYFRRVKETDPYDNGGDVDTDVDLEPEYEYMVGCLTVEKATPEANYDDPTTVKLVQILPGRSLAFTPTVGGGVDEVDGGVPNVVAVDGTEIKVSEEDGPYRELTYIAAGGRGLIPGVFSAVEPENPFGPDQIYLAYTPSLGSYVQLFENDFFVYFGQQGNIDGLDMFFIIARRKVN